MRLIMNEHVFSITHVIAAAERNVVFMIIALSLYSFAFYSARQRGLLLQMGE
jgi:hypothetical protein